MAGIWVAGAMTLAVHAFSPVAPRDVPYEQLARELLEQQAPGLDATGADVDDVLAAGFVRLELGAFELLFPRASLADGEALERFQEAAQAILEGHATWADWVDPGEERLAAKELKADTKALQRWIGGWKDQDLADLEPGAELGASLPGKDKERAALARFNAALAGGALTPDTAGPAEASAPSEEPGPERARLVLLPDRRSFVSLCALVGLLREEQRSVYWGADVANWVEFRFDGTRVLALEFSGGDPQRWEAGVSMNERNKKGLREQVGQLAFASLSLATFGNRIDPDFSLSFCNNLVIDLYGEVDTRTDGDLRPRTSLPRKVFVPGGLSQGGSLPPNSAESPWRQGLGQDYFVGVLRDSQKKGAKESGERRSVARFRLLSDDGVTSFVAKPPFFGTAAADTIVPGERFRGDWLELQRTYRVAFCHWLRNHGAGREKASHAAFAEVLERLAQGDDTTDFAALLEEVYDTRISTAQPGPDDLEGRFLIWLSKQR